MQKRRDTDTYQPYTGAAHPPTVDTYQYRVCFVYVGQLFMPHAAHDLFEEKDPPCGATWLLNDIANTITNIV